MPNTFNGIIKCVKNLKELIKQNIDEQENTICKIIQDLIKDRKVIGEICEIRMLFMKLDYSKKFYLLYNESVTYQTNLNESLYPLESTLIPRLLSSSIPL